MDARGGAGRRVVMSMRMPFWPRAGTRGREGLLVPSAVGARAYVQALGREAADAADDYWDCTVAALMVGGGAAANVADAELGEAIHRVARSYRMAGEKGAAGSEGYPAEVTVRACVGNLSAASLAMCMRAGATRLEVDLGTADPAESRALGWPASPDALAVTRTVLCGSSSPRTPLPGWLDVGIRLLVGIDGQRPATARRSARAALDFGATSVGVRALAPTGADPEVSRALEEELERAGMCCYLPGEWAFPGHECRYRRLEAAGCEALGFGLGALTRIDGAWARETTDLAAYLAADGDPAQLVALAGRL